MTPNCARPPNYSRQLATFVPLLTTNMKARCTEESQRANKEPKSYLADGGREHSIRFVSNEHSPLKAIEEGFCKNTIVWLLAATVTLSHWQQGENAAVRNDKMPRQKMWENEILIFLSCFFFITLTAHNELICEFSYKSVLLIFAKCFQSNQPSYL